MAETWKCPKCKKGNMVEKEKGIFSCNSCGETYLTGDSDYLQNVKKILDMF